MTTQRHESRSAHDSNSRWAGHGTNCLLWALQGLLAALVLFAGGVKLVLPIGGDDSTNPSARLVTALHRHDGSVGRPRFDPAVAPGHQASTHAARCIGISGDYDRRNDHHA